VGRQDLVHVDRLDVLDVHADVVTLGPHDRAEQDGAQTRNAHAAVDVQMRGPRLDEHQLAERTLHRSISSPHSFRGVRVNPREPHKRYRAHGAKSTFETPYIWGVAGIPTPASR